MRIIINAMAATKPVLMSLSRLSDSAHLSFVLLLDERRQRVIIASILLILLPCRRKQINATLTNGIANNMHHVPISGPIRRQTGCDIDLGTNYQHVL